MRRTSAVGSLALLLTLVAGTATACAAVDVEGPGQELMDQAQQVANEALVAAAQTGLEALQASGALTEEAVRDALEAAGAADVETRIAGDSLLFGAAVSGGCVYGSVDVSGGVTVDLGGVNTDGGCLREP